MPALEAVGFDGVFPPLLASSDVVVGAGSEAVVDVDVVDMLKEADLGVMISAFSFRAAQAKARLLIKQYKV